MGGERARGRGVLGALCLGHFAAAYSFSVSNMIAMVLLDPSVPVMEPLRSMTEFAGIALGLPPVVLLAMLPFSLLSAPFTIFAALRLRAGAGTALAVGAVVGAAWVLWFEAKTDELPGTWSRAGLPGDPRTGALIVVDGAIAGMAYAWVIWSRCVRPRLDRGSVLRSKQA